METKLERPLEAKLIEDRRREAIPPMSPEVAARAIPISGKRWREIEKGFDAAGRPTRARPALLAKIAKLLNITPEDLDRVDRADAARIHRATLQQEEAALQQEREEEREAASSAGDADATPAEVQQAIEQALQEIDENPILTAREKAELRTTFLQTIHSDVAVRRQQFALILRATIREVGTDQN
ncbi:hypothetical protein [Sphaerisporangium sp. NPDC051011]|uniref:hypothetical protein n=1 Tax=Sphaerisporangium sp. NPDC051011 TaxID=3155792 RepID=UPI003404F9F3